MATLAPVSQGYRPSLDGLRGFAILFVLIEHSFPNILPYGYLGVDIFFVLSGYVVTLSLLRSFSDGNPLALTNFYIRRFKRLAPILYISVFCFLALSFLFVYPYSSELIVSLQTGVASLFGVSNIYLYFTNQDYFSILSSQNLFLHTWSLGIEEQFYLFFPFLFFLVRNRRKILFLTLVGFVISYIFQIYYLIQPEAYNTAFYLPISRFWQLLLGAIAALCLNFFTTFLNRLSHPFINILSILLSFTLLYGVLTGYVEQLWLTYTLLSFNVFLLILLLEFSSSVKIIYQNFIILFFGLRSYSIYLFHWPLLVITSWIVVRSPLVSFFCILITIFLSLFSYTFIEQPFRYNQILDGTKKIIPVYLSCSILVSAFLYLIFAFRQFIFLGSVNLSTSPNVSLFLPHRAIAPTIKNTSLTRQKCFKRFSFTNDILITPTDVDNCSLPPISGSNTIHLYGDSFAAHLSPLLETLHLQNGFGVEIFTRARCPFPPRYDIQEDPCHRFFLQRKQRLLSTVKAGDVVLLATSAREPSGRYTEAYMASLRSITSLLQQKDVILIYQDPLPRFPKTFDPVCTYPNQWFQINRYSHCISPSYVNRQSELNRLSTLKLQLQELSIQFSNFYILESFNYFCPPSLELCSTNSVNARLYRDGIHLSTYASQSLYELFLETLQSSPLYPTLIND